MARDIHMPKSNVFLPKSNLRSKSIWLRRYSDLTTTRHQCPKQVLQGAQPLPWCLMEKAFSKSFDLVDKFLFPAKSKPRSKPLILDTLFFLSGFSFMYIYESQDCKGQRRAFLSLLTNTSLCFTDTQTLVGLLLQTADLCIQIAAGLKPGTSGFQAQVANH